MADREIKFRAWAKENKKMVYYDKDCSAPDMTLNGVLISHDKQSNVSYQYELMQSTGLKDKNGKEGYQDDIALCSDGKYGLVIWKDSGWYLKRRSKAHTDEWYAYIDLSYCVGTLEFAGNKHQNPELLKNL